MILEAVKDLEGDGNDYFKVVSGYLPEKIHDKANLRIFGNLAEIRTAYLRNVCVIHVS